MLLCDKSGVNWNLLTRHLMALFLKSETHILENKQTDFNEMFDGLEVHQPHYSTHKKQQNIEKRKLKLSHVKFSHKYQV